MLSIFHLASEQVEGPFFHIIFTARGTNHRNRPREIWPKDWKFASRLLFERSTHVQWSLRLLQCTYRVFLMSLPELTRNAFQSGIPPGQVRRITRLVWIVAKIHV